ncbi:unnamed protein product [marine sediment metagenome]|uniref:Uncharacterized protein n=1 Tax=marine sediment metagenome TaxID=412755 RepID=X1R2S8_9ZZZZ
MNPIELGKAIAEYGVPIITGILLVLIVCLMKWFMNEQSKTNKSILGMSKVEMKAIGDTMEKMQKTIQKGNSTNARLNRKSITMIGGLAEYINTHFNGNNDKVNFNMLVICFSPPSFFQSLIFQPKFRYQKS